MGRRETHKQWGRMRCRLSTRASNRLAGWGRAGGQAGGRAASLTGAEGDPEANPASLGQQPLILVADEALHRCKDGLAARRGAVRG